MNTEYDMTASGDRQIVYVRPVEVADLPEEMREAAGATTRIYALHNEDGERLALVRDERLAFVLARQNDLSAVRVH